MAAFPGGTLRRQAKTHIARRQHAGDEQPAIIVPQVLEDPEAIIPAFQASRLNLAETLKEGGRGSSGGPAGNRIRRLLVVAEVALALVVTLGAALMVRSLVALTDQETGLGDVERVLTMRVPVPDDRYESDSELIGAYRRMESNVAELPGVESAGLSSMLPLQDWGWNGLMSVEGKPPLKAALDGTRDLLIARDGQGTHVALVARAQSGALQKSWRAGHPV